MYVKLLLPALACSLLLGCKSSTQDPTNEDKLHSLTVYSKHVIADYPTSIANNDSITIDLHPEPGFDLKAAYVNGEKVALDNNKLTITNITSDVLLHAIAIPNTALPRVYIETLDNAQILNKVDYVESTVSVIDRTPEGDLTSAVAGVRLRGNSTMVLPKKPYRIKFDKKQAMFGRPEFKNWVLLADYYDLTHIKNFTAYTLAEQLDGMHFSPLAVHVNVYLNNEYQGVYLLSDQVQENEGRAGVEAKIKATDTEVPFLVELDEYAPNEGDLNIDYFTVSTRHFAIKYPEKDDRKSDAQFDYIKNYIKSVDTAVRIDSNWEELIDIDSFIDFYLVQELLGQGEINKKSVYMSKKVSEKLTMGPVWDFDWSAGGPISYFSATPTISWKKEGWFSSDNWFATLLKSKEFTDKLKQRWTEIDRLLDLHIQYVEAYKGYIEMDVAQDHEKWERFIGTENPLLTFDGQYEYVLDYLKKRKIWMTGAIQALNPGA